MVTLSASGPNFAVAEGTKGMVVSEEEKVERAKEESEVPALLERWAELNLCRAVCPFAGAVIGLYGVVLMK